MIDGLAWVRFKIEASGYPSSTPEVKKPRTTAAKPTGLRTSARQGLAMVVQWFHRWAETEGVDGLPPN